MESYITLGVVVIHITIANGLNHPILDRQPDGIRHIAIDFCLLIGESYPVLTESIWTLSLC